MTDTDTALADLICLDMHKFDQPDWRAQQKAMLAETGALVLSGFLQANALARLQDEAEAGLSCLFQSADPYCLSDGYRP